VNLLKSLVFRFIIDLADYFFIQFIRNLVLGVGLALPPQFILYTHDVVISFLLGHPIAWRNGRCTSKPRVAKLAIHLRHDSWKVPRRESISGARPYASQSYLSQSWRVLDAGVPIDGSVTITRWFRVSRHRQSRIAPRPQTSAAVFCILSGDTKFLSRKWEPSISFYPPHALPKSGILISSVEPGPDLRRTLPGLRSRCKMRLECRTYSPKLIWRKTFQIQPSEMDSCAHPCRLMRPSIEPKSQYSVKMLATGLDGWTKAASISTI
jgi:hypothetical protein